MEFQALINQFGFLQQEFGPLLYKWLLIFSRVLAFLFFCPIFSRKDIAFTIKLSFAIFLTVALIWVVPNTGINPRLSDNWNAFLIQIFLNATIGMIIGFLADLILHSAYVAGGLINNQIGLSSSVFSDPATRKQAALLETLFTYITSAAFIYAGGIQWMILALKKSFETFPVFAVQQPITQVIQPEYVIHLSGQILMIGVELAAPIFVVTIAVDVILAVVNRTAQQIQVFQLSYGVKPSIGVLVLIATLPLFVNTLMHYLRDYSKIF